jgi:hypothetical protein
MKITGEILQYYYELFRYRYANRNLTNAMMIWEENKMTNKQQKL